MRARGLNGWEILAAGLGAGLLAHAAPGVAAIALLVGFIALVRADRIDISSGRQLLTLAGIALAALLWGPTGAVAAALAWRTSVEVAARGDGGLRAHAWTLPMTAVAWRLGAPELLVAGLACIALVAWLDWIVRVLADWRLDADTEGRVGAFVSAQGAVLAPLLIFPDPTACLIALMAMSLARAISWDARAPAASYAIAR